MVTDEGCGLESNVRLVIKSFSIRVYGFSLEVLLDFF